MHSRTALNLGSTVRTRVAAIAVTVALLSLRVGAPGRATTTVATPRVLLVGTYDGMAGDYTTIKAAVDAARPGDWILVGPGDYHETQDYSVPWWPSGVWIKRSNIHLR